MAAAPASGPMDAFVVRSDGRSDAANPDASTPATAATHATDGAPATGASRDDSTADAPSRPAVAAAAAAAAAAEARARGAAAGDGATGRGTVGAGAPPPAKRRAGAPNYEFYMNRLVSRPWGHTIEKWHEIGRGNYELLERHHGFIQWLFPTRTASMVNRDVPPLSDADVAAMQGSEEVGRRLITSYSIMLDFYGMELVDERTGVVRRGASYRERYYEAIEMSWHNHLRICRIMSCFSALGFRRYVQPLMDLLLEETKYKPTGARLPGEPAIDLPFRPVSMWLTYVDNTTAAYRKFSGVKPSDEHDHVLLKRLDAEAANGAAGGAGDAVDGDAGGHAGRGAGAGAGAGAGVQPTDAASPTH